MPQKAWRKVDWILFAAVMLVALLTRAATFNRPFERDPEGCGAFYGQLARNYLRYGVVKTFGVPIQNLGIHSSDIVFYQNHPPLLPLLSAGVYWICGWNPTGNDVPPDWQTRLPTVAFTLACVATIFISLRARASPRAAAIAAFLFATVPMTLYFGSQPDVINTQLVFFAILTTLAYLRFHEKPTAGRFALMCLAFAPAAATDWPAFHLVVVLGLHFVITQPMRRWPWIIGFGFVCAMYFFALYSEVVAVTHDWRWMSRLVARRAMSSESDAGAKITLVEWIKAALGRHALGNHTIFVAIAMLGWIVLAAKKLRKHPATRLIGLLLGWALLHVLVGRQGVFVHEWWWWPLTAGAVMSAAVAIDWALNCISNPRLANSVLVASLLAFASWNIYVVHDKLAHPYVIVHNDLNYTVKEIGDAIRAAAPIDECVLLAESDDTLGLWFYADRPIKRFVWYPEKFEERMNDGFSDLPFGLYEKWTKPPEAMIVPRAYLSSNLQPFVDYLDARYARSESAKFITFDLTKSKKESPRMGTNLHE